MAALLIARTSALGRGCLSRLGKDMPAGIRRNTSSDLIRRFSDTSASEEETAEKIKRIIEGHPVVLFLKGTKASPQCGYSLATLRLLEASGAEDIKDVNVLEDKELRSGIKKYRFIGGYDIALTLYKSGELKKLLVREKIVDPSDN